MYMRQKKKKKRNGERESMDRRQGLDGGSYHNEFLETFPMTRHMLGRIPGSKHISETGVWHELFLSEAESINF